jgi:hypothetical protein
MNFSILVTDDQLEEIVAEVNRVEDFDHEYDQLTLDEVKANKKLFMHLMTGGTVMLDNNMKPTIRVNVSANYAVGNYDDLWQSRIK